MSPISQVGVLGGAAAVLVLVLSLLFRMKKAPNSNKSKGERAKEMRLAFQSIEKRNLVTNRKADMKVGAFLPGWLLIYLLTR